MLVLGVILFILGLIFHIGFLTWLGVILAIIGLVLLLLGSSGRPVGGRRYWY